MRPTELLQFAIKAELKERPMIVMTVFFLLSIIVSAFILRAAEMPADEQAGDRFGFSYIWNSMWCSFITISTVGYGDIFPVSTMGKIICAIIMFWGNFLISLIIVSLANLVEFGRQEAKAYFQITNELAISNSFQSGSNLIKTFFRYLVIKRKEE